MSTHNYTTSITVDQTPEAVFNAINNVAAWWSANFDGESTKLDDTFTVSFGETWITSKVTELVPNQKITWLVTDCHKHWLKDKKEWVGTQMEWEITTPSNATQLNFTHVGLIPGIECYKGCEGAWTFYIKESLMKLITEGKGEPESKK